MNGGLCDEHLVEGAYDVSSSIDARDTPSQKIAHLLVIADNVVCSRKHENVFRHRAGAGRGYYDLWSGVACSKGDVYVPDVVVGCHDHCGFIDRGFFEGVDFIKVSEHHGHAHIMDSQGFIKLLNNQYEWVVELLQLVHEGMADGVVVGEDYMFFFSRIELSRYPCPHLKFHEGLVQELHEEEGEHDEEIDDSREHDEHGEDSSEVANEGDVAIAKGGHRRKYPVEAFDPTDVCPPFLTHEVLKAVHIGADEEEQDSRKPEYPGDILRLAPLSENAW